MAAKNGSTTIEKEQIFGMAEQEMEYRVDLFNRLTKICFDKCIDKRHKESELNMGENSCIDRCVSKYWQKLIAWSNQMPDQYELLQEFAQAVTNLIGQLLGSNRPPM